MDWHLLWLLDAKTYENTSLTPPFNPLVKCPLPLPPASTCALTTTSLEPDELAVRDNQLDDIVEYHTTMGILSRRDGPMLRYSAVVHTEVTSSSDGFFLRLSNFKIWHRDTSRSEKPHTITYVQWQVSGRRSTCLKTTKTPSVSKSNDHVTDTYVNTQAKLTVVVL